MSKKYRVWVVAGVVGIAIAVIGYALSGNNVVMLNPNGTIAAQQRDLLVWTTALSLVVVIPVFVMTFLFAWRYRESNSKAKYTPEWDHSKKLEAIWWLIPLGLIIILGIVTWRTSHSLDPFKPLESSVKPVKVQVIALEWKWLFIYPEHDIATVNYLQIPEDTPIDFQITADAPMNSFWIPQLGGQIYAMAGMTTKLHLMADSTGRHNGVSSNLSGKGFADMNFIVDSTSKADFTQWVESTKSSNPPLNKETYSEISTPGISEKLFYGTVEESMYDTVVMKYMMPPGTSHGGSSKNGGSH